jgi:hypothetical protein
MSSGFESEGNGLLRGFTRPATWRSFTWANEKFHLSPTSQHDIGKFGDAEVNEFTAQYDGNKYLEIVFSAVQNRPKYNLASLRALAVWWIRTYQLEVDPAFEQTRMKQYAEDLFLAQKLDEKINRDFATVELDEHPAKLTFLAQELLDLKKLNELSDELIHSDSLTAALETYMYGQRLLAVLLDLNCYISTIMRRTLLDGLMKRSA